MPELIPRLDGRGFHAVNDSVAESLSPQPRDWRWVKWALGGLLAVIVLVAFTAIVIHGRKAIFAERTASHMKQVVFGFSNHLDQESALPSRANFSPAGKPLLSWRVHLLPQLGYEELYSRFRLDEPWDSAHNRALIGEMPPLYGLPGVTLPPGKTCYVVPVADRVGLYREWRGKIRKDEVVAVLKCTAFPATPPRVRSPDDYHLTTRRGFSPGSPNKATLMLVCVKPESAVTWTAPDDLNVGEPVSPDDFYEILPGRFAAATFDSKVHWITLEMPVNQLQRHFEW